MIETKTIEIGSQTICYRESAGPGLPILFVHGNSCSSRAFDRQFVAPLMGRYRMIAFDLPGHGRSPNARDPQDTYSLPGYASIIQNLARLLDIENAVFVGWSLGGHILLEAAGKLPNASGFLICGTPPVGRDMSGDPFLPSPAAALLFKGNLSEGEADLLGSSFFLPEKGAPKVFREDLRRTDCLARSSLGENTQSGRFTDERQVAANLAKPLAVIHGSGDPLVNADYLRSLRIPTLWRGAVQMVSEAGHAVLWEQPAKFNALLEEFTRECFEPF